jgi:hypothetical protein
VLTCGEVDEPVDAATHTDGFARADVMDEELGRIAGLSGLLGREEPLLGGRCFEEAVPVGGLPEPRSCKT